MKEKPFSLLIDGSNDTGIEKLNPLTVRIYDDNQRQVVSMLQDMCIIHSYSVVHLSLHLQY